MMTKNVDYDNDNCNNNTNFKDNYYVNNGNITS